MKNKNGLKAVFMAALLSVASFSVSAQKTGYINVQDLIDIMPSYSVAEKALNDFGNSLVTPEFQALLKSHDDKLTLLEAKVKNRTIGDADRELEAKTILKLEEQIEAIRKENTQRFNTKQEELMGPVFIEAQKLVDETALANGFDVVIDMSTSSITYIYINPNFDLLPFIKQKLGAN